ncbi:MAG: glycolate oxidase subunit GlcE [Betaproteobacteria bacterium]|nr:MAG: glycolate oxidase subunit GlcE [Betaproteobacteria bacterium]
MNDLIAAWPERIRAAAAMQTPLRIVGGGSKDFYGQELCGERFEAASYRGIVDYDPTELVITARCGTPLAEVERTLSEGRQMLAFEPPHFGPHATFGGCIAAGLSGPRRPYAGAVRDVVLGVLLLDGRGDELSFGGRVMKNVAGFDISRLVAGSLGTLGVLLEASIKCLPLPKAELTLVLELNETEAMRRFEEWSGLPLPLSASCWHANRLIVRLSGASSAIDEAKRRIGGEELHDAKTFWTGVREQQHPFFRQNAAGLWRCSVRPTAPSPDVDGDPLIEWSGALRWFNGACAGNGSGLRDWAQRHGGHATLFRGSDKTLGAFQALPPAIAALHQRIKATFDPAGIFNRHRMYPQF